MRFDELPDLPEIKKEDYPEESEEFVLEEFRNSERRIMIYESKEGEFRFLFSGLDDVLYAGLVASLSRPQPKYENVYNFFKLSMEGVRLAKKCTKRAFDSVVKICNYFK